MAGSTPTTAEATAIYAGATVLGSVTPTGSSSPYTATYTWSSADFPNVTSSPITYYVYAILSTDLGASCRPTQEIQVTVYPLATVTAGGPDIVCQSASPTAITLAGAGIGGGASTGAWTIVSGGGALSSTAQTATPATVTYTPAANYTGTVTLRLTTNDPTGPCGVVTVDRTITVNPIATVVAGGPDVVCQSASPTAMILAGASVGGGASTGAWSIISGGGSLSSTAQTATPATVTYTPATNYTGTVTLRLTTNDPTGPCGMVAADRTITVNPLATVTAGGPNAVCQSSSPTAITLTGASVGGGATTGAWSIISGGGALSTTSQTALPAAVTYTPSANYTGTVTLRLTTNVPSASCPSATADRTITINPKPILSIDASTCQVSLTQYDVAFTASGGTVTASVGTVSGSSIINIPIASSVTITVTNGTTGCSVSTNVTPPDCSCPNVTPPLSGGDQTICQGATTPTLTATVGVGETVDWYDAVIGGTKLLDNMTSFTPTAAGTYYAQAHVLITGCNSSTRTPITLTINPTPSVTDLADQVVCAGAQTTSAMFSGSTVNGTTYNWTNNTPSIGLAASGTGDIAAFTAVNTGTTAVVATITVTPMANNCAGTVQTFTITVKPSLSVTAISNLMVCNGATMSVPTFGGSGVSGTTYSWTNNTPSIGLAASGTGDITTFTAVNTGTLAVVATITVTPMANSCTGIPQVFTITVKPSPSVNDLLDQIVCTGTQTANIVYSGSGIGGTTYSWINNTPSIGLAANGMGDIAPFTTVNATTSPVTASITVTPSVNGCSGTPQMFSITVMPLPSSITLTPTAPTCTGSTSDNNGRIVLTAVMNGTHFGMSSINATSYDGVAYAAATAISLPQTVQMNVPNTGGAYIIRIFNGSNDCYKDQTVTVSPVFCCTITSANALATCSDNGTSFKSNDDYYTIVIDPTASNCGAQYNVTAIQRGVTTNYGPFSYGTPFQLPTHFLIINGTTTVTVKDVNSSTTTFTTTVEQPCSIYADPTGYIYCQETGTIVKGGLITVTPPSGGSILNFVNGSDGFYKFKNSGAGVYTIAYTPPPGYALSTTHLAATGVGTGGSFNPTLGSADNPNALDPIFLGSASTTFKRILEDITPTSNTFYWTFDFTNDDPDVFLNNIPLSGCATSSNCEPLSVNAFAACHDNGTSSTGLDDYYTISLNPGSSGCGTQYLVDVTQKGITTNYGPFTYGSSTSLSTHFLILDGNATVKVTNYTTDSNGITQTITAPTACSVIPCPPKICLPVTVVRVH